MSGLDHPAYVFSKEDQDTKTDQCYLETIFPSCKIRCETHVYDNFQICRHDIFIQSVFMDQIESSKIKQHTENVEIDHWSDIIGYIQKKHDDMDNQKTPCDRIRHCFSFFFAYNTFYIHVRFSKQLYSFFI